MPELFDVRDGVIWNRLTGTVCGAVFLGFPNEPFCLCFFLFWLQKKVLIGAQSTNRGTPPPKIIMIMIIVMIMISSEPPWHKTKATRRTYSTLPPVMEADKRILLATVHFYYLWKKPPPTPTPPLPSKKIKGAVGRALGQVLLSALSTALGRARPGAEQTPVRSGGKPRRNHTFVGLDFDFLLVLSSGIVSGLLFCVTRRIWKGFF